MIAVIGLGYWGKNLARNLHELGVLSLVCDKSEQTLAAISANYPGVATCLAFSEVLSRPEITGVIIATPAETHFALAREALLADKHVFVEKPLVLHEAEGEELIALADERGLTLMVGHLLQYHSAFRRLKELVAAGELGRINYIYSHRLNLGKVRREENILWSFAPHDISMILALAEGEPEQVTATGGNYLHKKIADVTVTHLDFPSGLKAHIFVSWLHPFKVQSLVVVGERQMAVFDDTKPWGEKLLLFPHKIKWEHNMPVPSRAEPVRVELLREEPLRVECAHFVSCIRTGAAPLTDGREGLAVLRVLNASQRVLDGKEAPVSPASAGKHPDPGYSLHPTAVVDSGARIGRGTKIWHFSHILGGSTVGEGVNIGQNVVVGPDVSIGNGCKIQNNVSVYKGVTLEDDVFCGPSMVFTNILNPRANIPRMHELRRTLVCKGATLGANSTIVCGHTVGRYAFVGAGSVVTRDVPDFALVVGNPGRRIGWMCACGARLPEDLACPECGKRYHVHGEGLKDDIDV